MRLQDRWRLRGQGGGGGAFETGATIRDGDRNEMPFGFMGLSPCVVPKNLFLEKIIHTRLTRTRENGQDCTWRN